MLDSERRVAYYYNREVAQFHYGEQHPMKPHRLALTHALILSYDLWDKMDVYRPKKATEEDLKKYHTSDYIDFLKKVTPETPYSETVEYALYGDCPGFPSLFEFCQLYTGGSIEGAWKLNQKQTDIAINWAGGLHHARKSSGSGFCYVNDIVLAIIELLRYHPRVLYIDIDVHHGDGVQDAFYYSDRVMTVSFHKYGNGFFPNTGSINEIGLKTGKYYSVNVPLKDGIDDITYTMLFKEIMSDVIDRFRPTAIVLQCGADSLRGDRIGTFNLTFDGHAECVRYIASFNIPLLVLGGGGYTIKNVARCWANETATLLGITLDDDIPPNDYYSHYSPDFKLRTHSMPVVKQYDVNCNTKSYIDNILTKVKKNLRSLEGAPSVQMQYIPMTNFDSSDDENDETEDVDSYVEIEALAPTVLSALSSSSDVDTKPHLCF